MRSIINIFVLLLIMSTNACSPSYTSKYKAPDTPPPAREFENIDVVLVLGGGGARGVAHLGAIKALEDNNIPIDMIIGSSAGSIVGGLYADTPDTQRLYEIFSRTRREHLLDVSYYDSFFFFSDLVAPIKGDYLEDFINNNISKCNIEDFKIPFIAVATNLATGAPYAFDSGPAPFAIRASSALPPLFTPIEAHSTLYADGGVAAPIPVRIAKKYNPKIIIAVDISSKGDDYNIKNMAHVAQKSFTIAYYVMSSQQSSEADMVIRPDLAGVSTFDEINIEALLEIGYLATLHKIDAIKDILKNKKII